MPGARPGQSLHMRAKVSAPYSPRSRPAEGARDLILLEQGATLIGHLTSQLRVQMVLPARVGQAPALIKVNLSDRAEAGLRHRLRHQLAWAGGAIPRQLLQKGLRGGACDRRLYSRHWLSAALGPPYRASHLEVADSPSAFPCKACIYLPLLGAYPTVQVGGPKLSALCFSVSTDLWHLISPRRKRAERYTHTYSCSCSYILWGPPGPLTH